MAAGVSSRIGSARFTAICLSNLNFSKVLLHPWSCFWTDMTFHLLQFALMSHACSEKKQEFINFLLHGLATRQEEFISHTSSGARRPFIYMLPRESIKCMHANWLWCFICVSFQKLWHEAKTIKKVEHMIVITPYTFTSCRTSLNFGWTLGTPSLAFRNRYFFPWRELYAATSELNSLSDKRTEKLYFWLNDVTYLYDVLCSTLVHYSLLYIFLCLN
jgi:hypothetical protein